MQQDNVASARAFALALTICLSLSTVKTADAQSSREPICATDESPFRDLDFLLGAWEFFTLDGRMIANQVYSRREKGCLILEDWKTLSGETGTGMNFVDPFTGKWRQVWMSPRFHLDYSGGLVDTGLFVLEGRMYPNDGSGAASIKGIYTRQQDGSVKKEFLRRSDGEWQSFFVGVARRPVGQVTSK